MFQQHYISRSAVRHHARRRSRPATTSPSRNEDTEYPYFTSWIKQQVVDQLGGGQAGAKRAFEGGLTVQTTIDSELQEAAQRRSRLAAARAARTPRSWRSTTRTARCGRWSAATTTYNASRSTWPPRGSGRPGSTFKPFMLAEALARGIRPAPSGSPARRPTSSRAARRFTVNNYEDSYSGTRTLAERDDLLRQLRLRPGRHEDRARRGSRGWRSGWASARRSRTTCAMTLGGLNQGVTPLDMAHAYETFADGGKLKYGTLAPGLRHQERARARPGRHRRDHPRKRRQAGRVLNGGEAGQPPQAQTVLTPAVARSQLDPPERHPERHRHRGRSPGRRDRRQDRHDRGLRRRLVRRLDEGVHGGRLGRLSRQVQVDEDRVPRASRWRAAPSRPRSGATFMQSLLKIAPAAQGRRRRRHRHADRPDARHGHRRRAPTTGAPPTRPRRRAPAGRPRRRRRTTARADGRADQHARADRRPPTGAAPRRHRPAARTGTPTGVRGDARDRRAGGGAHHGRGGAHARDPAARARDAASRGAEAPRQLGGLGDPDPRPGRRTRQRLARPGSGPARRAATCRSRSAMPSAWVSLPGPLQGQLDARPAPRAHVLEPVERLQRTDQHRRADPLGLADRVQQGVDAVGAIDVGGARRAEQHARCAA